jgi:Chlorophyll A-B binding protein
LTLKSKRAAQLEELAMTSENTPVTTPAPKPSLDQPPPAFGWTAYAEQINGRFAMVGFITLLGMEFFTRQDFWTWLGF